MIRLNGRLTTLRYLHISSGFYSSCLVSLTRTSFRSFFSVGCIHINCLLQAFILIQLDRYNDDRFSVVCFQRSTVILTELVLAWATVRYLRSSRVPSRLQALALGAIVGNGGLLLVDHIHFQYNGFLIGILVLTLDFCNKVS